MTPISKIKARAGRLSFTEFSKLEFENKVPNLLFALVYMLYGEGIFNLVKN